VLKGGAGCTDLRGEGNSSPVLVKPPRSGAAVARVFRASNHGMNSALALDISLGLDW
jgi:hypothetical protein